MKRPKTSEQGVEDVFSPGVRVASAPSSVAAKAKKSETILKAEIGREQLVFASDNLPANFNA